jgi:hypothetical protein
MNPTCQTCRFVGPTGRRGRPVCRRYPPTVQVVVESRTFKKDHYEGVPTWSEKRGDVSLWPSTTSDAWCGEHQPKDRPHG